MEVCYEKIIIWNASIVSGYGIENLHLGFSNISRLICAFWHTGAINWLYRTTFLRLTTEYVSVRLFPHVLLFLQIYIVISEERANSAYSWLFGQCTFGARLAS